MKTGYEFHLYMREGDKMDYTPLSEDEGAARRVIGEVLNAFLCEGYQLAFSTQSPDVWIAQRADSHVLIQLMMVSAN